MMSDATLMPLCEERGDSAPEGFGGLGLTVIESLPSVALSKLLTFTVWTLRLSEVSRHGHIEIRCLYPPHKKWHTSL